MYVYIYICILHVIYIYICVFSILHVRIGSIDAIAQVQIKLHRGRALSEASLGDAQQASVANMYYYY